MVRFIRPIIYSNWLTTWVGKITTGGIMGILTPIAASFEPIGTMVTWVCITMMIDMIFGIWRSVKVKRNGFKSGRLWKTIIKMLSAVVLIWLTHNVDAYLFGAEIYKIIAGVIIGFDVWSILENMAALTDHPVFRGIKKLMSDKIKTSTGIDIEDHVRDRGFDDNDIKMLREILNKYEK